MDAATLNAIGLALDIVGVVVVFFYGFPQPSFEEGCAICVTDNTPMPDGRTAAEHDEDLRRKKRHYLRMSRIALALIIVGFGFQLWATLK